MLTKGYGEFHGKNLQFTIWIYLLKLTYWWNRIIGQSYSKIETNYSGISLLQVWTVCWNMLGNMGRTCRFNHGFWMIPNDFIFGSRYIKLRVTVRSISKGTTPRSLYFSLVKDYNSATSKHDDVQNTGLQVKLYDPFGLGSTRHFLGTLWYVSPTDVTWWTGECIWCLKTGAPTSFISWSTNFPIL